MREECKWIYLACHTEAYAVTSAALLSCDGHLSKHIKRAQKPCPKAVLLTSLQIQNHTEKTLDKNSKRHHKCTVQICLRHCRRCILQWPTRNTEVVKTLEISNLEMRMVLVLPVDGEKALMRATSLQLTLVMSERGPPNNNRIFNLIRKQSRTNFWKSQ